ncbi:glycerate kinase type-2 family protein [Desulfobacterium sp. N47]
MSFKMQADARLIWEAGLGAVDPERLATGAVSVVAGKLIIGAHSFELDAIERIAVVGAGKAGRAMAEAIESILGPELIAEKNLSGIVNVLDKDAGKLSRIVLNGSRPTASAFPTPEGQAGTESMLDIVKSLHDNDLAICLLSGGGSAMMPAPVTGVSIDAKRKVTKLLSEAGATISQLNTVRKHLSRVKGGRLAEQCSAGALVSLIISDVVGDRLDTIASGPTAVDKTSFADALRIVENPAIFDRVPKEVLNHITKGANGAIQETPKSLPPSIINLVLGNNVVALAAAEEQASRLGYNVLNLGSRIEGEAREVAVVLAAIALSIKHESKPLRPPVCILAGGETTVSGVAPGGKGGRNQELVLAALEHLSGWGMDGILIWSAGTDGEDGPTDAAGAFADESIMNAAHRQGLIPQHYLAESRSYDFFGKAAGHIKIGPTGTNVMDICIILVS